MAACAHENKLLIWFFGFKEIIMYFILICLFYLNE